LVQRAGIYHYDAIASYSEKEISNLPKKENAWRIQKVFNASLHEPDLLQAIGWVSFHFEIAEKQSHFASHVNEFTREVCDIIPLVLPDLEPSNDLDNEYTVVEQKEDFTGINEKVSCEIHHKIEIVFGEKDIF
jgi:hypothetical protein